MKIGAQISSAGGADKVFERAELIEAEAIQMFISAPQQWRAPSLSDEVAAHFISERERAALPVMHPGRVDVIGGGALVLQAVVRRLGLAEVLVSESDILDGIALSITEET